MKTERQLKRLWKRYKTEQDLKNRPYILLEFLQIIGDGIVMDDVMEKVMADIETDIKIQRIENVLDGVITPDVALYH